VLGAMLLEAGQAADAEQVYRDDLVRFRENGWSLFGLAQSLRAQQRLEAAAEVQRRFERAWTRADVRLTSSRIMQDDRAQGASAAHPHAHHHAHHDRHDLAEQQVDLPGRTRLSYVEQGDRSGIPVVLLHGYTDSWRSFERVLPHLPRSLHVFAITQRGHGSSGKPADGYTPSDFAGDIAAFLDAVGIESAIVVGHSMGATAAQRFAIDYPWRTRGLMLEGAFLPRAGNEGIREFWNTVSTLIDPIDPAMVRDFQHSTMARPVPVEFFETVVGESLKVPARVWKSALEPHLTIDFTAQLSEIDVPTLLVWGDRDAYTGRDEQDGIKGAISGSRLVTYVGVGHCPHWEEPERFAAQVVEFVKDLEQF
ncbi:MAG TPA: alpha/beta hydrolase, partial [Vicinamibacterales bacterium]|nr:alpha/beta hydrolase [Vicinamibacterales bacterium]